MNKGTIKPLDIMVKGQAHLIAVAWLGQQSISPNVVSELEAFVYALYGKPRMTKVDDVRYALLQ